MKTKLKDLKMNTKRTLVLTLVIACNALGQTSAPDRFQRFDKNADGKLSQEEFPYPYFFKHYDKDGDGLLSQAEGAEIKPVGKPDPASPGTTTPTAATTPATAAAPAGDFKPRPHGDEATKAGLKPEVLAQLDIVLQQAVANRDVSGVIGLIHRNGQRGYFEAFGWQDIEAQKPMPKDAIFRLQSMSKSVVAACAMSLVYAGKFTLDEPISRHLPEWEALQVQEKGQLVPARTPITPRMLMSHSSGLYYGTIEGAVRGSPDPAQGTTGRSPESGRPAVGGFGEVGRPAPSAERGETCAERGETCAERGETCAERVS